MSRTALEYIGQGGLGYSFDSFDGEDTNHYSRAVKDLLLALLPSTVIITTDSSYSSPTIFKVAIIRQYLPFLVKLGPPRFRRFLVDLYPSQTIQTVKKIVETMHTTSVEVFKSKTTALAQGDQAVAMQVGEGKDIMSVLRMCLWLSACYHSSCNSVF